MSELKEDEIEIAVRKVSIEINDMILQLEKKYNEKIIVYGQGRRNIKENEPKMELIRVY
jgi:hypothetical protein